MNTSRPSISYPYNLQSRYNPRSYQSGIRNVGWRWLQEVATDPTIVGRRRHDESLGGHRHVASQFHHPHVIPRAPAGVCTRVSPMGCQSTGRRRSCPSPPLLCHPACRAACHSPAHHKNHCCPIRPLPIHQISFPLSPSSLPKFSEGAPFSSARAPYIVGVATKI